MGPHMALSVTLVVCEELPSSYQTVIKSLLYGVPNPMATLNNEAVSSFPHSCTPHSKLQNSQTACVLSHCLSS